MKKLRISRQTGRRILLGTAAAAVFGLALIAGAWTRACAGGACPSIALLSNYDPDQASKVYAADGRLITDFGLQRRTVVTLQDMSPAVAAAFLSVEDKRFYQHQGVDWYRVFASFARIPKSVLTGERFQGWSTITMQLAGNLWPTAIDRRERTGLAGVRRKIREMRVAIEIEKHYPKDKILELYLNQINLGNQAFGVEAAAQRYFGKSAKHLNVAEAAMLAAIPKAPSRYNPRRNPDLAVQRRNLVISLMRENRRLSGESAEAWKAYPLQLSSSSDFTGHADYFVEYVRQQLDARFGADLYRAGLRIYTTVDLDMQLAAERAVESQLEAIESGKPPYSGYRQLTYREYMQRRSNADDEREAEGPARSPYLQAALVAMEARTCYVRALVGGRDFEDSKFNRATQALRQAGSTFKPFVYSAAIRAGYTFAEVMNDEPLSVPVENQANWEPQNYDNTFKGPMTLRQALFESRNTVAVRVGMRVGEDVVVAEAHRFGLTSRIPPVPSIHIGAADVLLIDMVAAYTAFANSGTRCSPVGILRVEDRQGRILWQPEVEQHEVMDPQHAWIMLDVLRDVVRRGTGYSAVVGGGFKYPAGGKTGTTNDYRDVWYLGFTSDLVTGIWMGFDEPVKIMGNAQGGRLVAPAWTRFMKEVYERREPPPAWYQPDGLVEDLVDVHTGMRATPFCPITDVVREYFIPGTEPPGYCPLHGGVRATFGPPTP
ncbi:MAG TPA: PBP1A family penicillin-binding protein [Gemmatimonadales bacterium]|nr:PBP1A family penicillin-binding protein [Gemmatimonadales bacterium]